MLLSSLFYKSNKVVFLQVIETISAVDRDEPPSGHRFFFSLAAEAAGNLNFTLRDNKGYPFLFISFFFLGKHFLCRSDLVTRF